MAGSDGTAVVPTDADLTWAIADGALGQPAGGTDQAATIGVNSSTLVGTGATVQAVFEEMDDAIATSLSTNNTQDTAIALALTYKPLYATLTADSATLATVTDPTATNQLTVTPLAAGTYDVEAFLPYTTDAASDFTVKFGGAATVTATAGTSDMYYVIGPLIGGDATTPTVKPLLFATSWTTQLNITTTGAPSSFPALFKGKLVLTVAGTIFVGCSQVSSTAFATKLNKGAWLKLQRVA